MKRPAVLFIIAFVLFAAVAVTAEDKSSDLKFLVIRDYNGKPVRNASVILHPIDSEGKQRGGYQLKTDAEGKTGFDGAPYGLLRIQVLAQGFQTYGEDFQINQPTTEITIKLKRPGGQYSIYDDKNQGSPENNQGSDKKDSEDSKNNNQAPK
jgi:hypothetical protein